MQMQDLREKHKLMAQQSHQLSSSRRSSGIVRNDVSSKLYARLTRKLLPLSTLLLASGSKEVAGIPSLHIQIPLV